MKRTLYVILGAVMFVMTSSLAFAAESPKEGPNAWAVFLGAGLAISITAFGASMAMGRAIDSALAGVSRNPSAGPRIMTMMILGLALIESLAIYALVVAILLLMVI
ncbi:MAG: ATP synthase F0 subunit C [Deferribacteraceae bacterium]|jgi:F-type H+-transporting ATPase subunit c|nr:ATP synthase F0 subunit C [Deferribacteraceae bacterium]